MKTFAIIIPTRNRTKLLQELIETLDLNQKELIEIIIVDSSDNSKSENYTKSKVKYIHTNIRSAATQRNIGVQNLNIIPNILFFLDDDVRVENSYFTRIIENFDKKDIVGVSGMAINRNNPSVRKLPSGIFGLIKRIFLLDSNLDGALLRSAINIPVRMREETNGKKIMAHWLIGCSAWRTDIFSELKFDDFFVGQSLGEDVLFSHKAYALGKLIVDTNIVIDHLESSFSRPDTVQFFEMWIFNRYQISKQLNLSPFNTAFHWANFGKLLAFFSRRNENNQERKNMVIGMLNGYKKIICAEK